MGRVLHELGGAMIGLVLVTHGRLADEFVTAMEHVVGKQERVATVAIGPDDDMEARRNDIAAAIARVDASSCLPICSAARPPISLFRCSNAGGSR
jgi:mannose PTS system EIIA component